MSSSMTARMQEGVKLAEDFLNTPRIRLRDLKPSVLPQMPGVYAIFREDTEETLYVGRTKNLRQRLYRNHLHGPFTNARLKKYLVEDPAENEISDIDAAKRYLLDYCYLQYTVEEDTLARGRLEGLLSYDKRFIVSTAGKAEQAVQMILGQWTACETHLQSPP